MTLTIFNLRKKCVLSGKGTNINIWVTLKIAEDAFIFLEYFANGVLKTFNDALIARSCVLPSN